MSFDRGDALKPENAQTIPLRMRARDRKIGGEMAMRKTPEEKAAQQAAKAKKQEEAAIERERQRVEQQRQAFYRTPAGLARMAYDEGDHIFQCAFNVMSQQAIIVAMVGSRTTKKTSDPTAILNSVCREGWELLNGSFVFIQEGQQSRDKFMSSGQNIATKGSTMGYYLFRRCEANLGERINPWEQQTAA
jgi:predicted phage gp36 major capsid-like protein